MNLNTNCADFYIRPSGAGRLVSFITDPPTRYFSVKNSCVSGSSDSIWLSRQADNNELILRGTASESNSVPVSVTIHDPPMYAATVLAESLRDAGIPVGSVERDRTVRASYHSNPGEWQLLAAHQTPLTTVIARANKDSMNLYAECCCKRLGFAVNGEGSWQSGTEAVGQFLHEIGVSSAEFHLDDGCGLSKTNYITADLMVSVLEHDFAGPNRQAYMDTMAIAGVDGTMEERFRGTDLRGRVHAKSGFVNGVSCLSGYLHGRDDNWYAFSILFNDVPAGGTSQAKAIEEKIVHLVDVDSTR
jgi:D-alanyl-D-alanine carboxypeptidase/D-alanyl-D-alanine-endopeptidase (penicillin-binding protein 4)